MDAPVYLLQNQTTDVTGDAKDISLDVRGEFIFRTLFAVGTWDSATVTVQFTPDDGTTWIDVPDATLLDENFAGNLHIRADKLRAVQANSGGSTSLTVGIV